MNDYNVNCQVIQKKSHSSKIKLRFLRLRVSFSIIPSSAGKSLKGVGGIGWILRDALSVTGLALGRALIDSTWMDGYRLAVCVFISIYRAAGAWGLCERSRSERRRQGACIIGYGTWASVWLWCALAGRGCCSAEGHAARSQSCRRQRRLEAWDPGPPQPVTMT
jgi:hypothetical protein